jgi:hypothetical protein
MMTQRVETFPTKETTMKYGHVTGTKRERKGSTDWYKQIEAANLARIEEEYALAGQRNLTEAEWRAQDTTDYGEESDGDLVPWDRAA